jgi:hypothetical protein
MKIREQLAARPRHLLKHGGSFTFSVTYSPEALEEIKEMGEEFSSRFLYTVADIPGIAGSRLICISLKNQNRRQ